MRLCAVKLLSFGNIWPFQLMPLPTLQHESSTSDVLHERLLYVVSLASDIVKSGVPRFRQQNAIYPATPEAPAAGDFSIEIVHIQAAAVEDGVRKVVRRHVLDAPAPMEGAQILQELLLQHYRTHAVLARGQVGQEGPERKIQDWPVCDNSCC